MVLLLEADVGGAAASADVVVASATTTDEDDDDGGDEDDDGHDDYHHHCYYPYILLANRMHMLLSPQPSTPTLPVFQEVKPNIYMHVGSPRE